MKRIVRATAMALALGTTLVVSGCGTNTAATVNGQTISEDELTTATRQINEAFKPQSPFTADKALTALIWAPAVLDYAKEKGFPQTESAAKAALALSDPDPATVRIVQSSNALDRLTQADQVELSQKLQGLKVSVNPKYGQFNAAEAMVAPAVPNWLTNAAG